MSSQIQYFGTFGPPKNFSGAKLLRANDIIFIDHVLKLVPGSLFSASGTRLPCALFLAGVQFHVCVASWCASLSSLTFSWCLVCFLVEFWTLLPWPRTRPPRLWNVNWERAVFDCISGFSSSRDWEGQSYPVEYCLESMEEYSDGRVHKSEPEPPNRNANTVYFIDQARGITRISRTEFVYD